MPFLQEQGVLFPFSITTSITTQWHPAAAHAGAAKEKAAIGYAFVTYDAMYKLYSSLLTLRPPPGSTSSGSKARESSNCTAWTAVAAAADGLAAAAARAQECIHGAVRGPALRAAEDLLHHAVDNHLAIQLCSCIEDAKADDSTPGMGKGATG